MTDPFHPLGPLSSKTEFHKFGSARNISSMWNVQVCVFDNFARALAEKHSTIGSEPSLQSFCLSY